MLFRFRAIAHIESVASLRKKVKFQGPVCLPIFLHQPHDGLDVALIVIGHQKERRRRIERNPVRDPKRTGVNYDLKVRAAIEAIRLESLAVGRHPPWDCSCDHQA